MSAISPHLNPTEGKDLFTVTLEWKNKIDPDTSRRHLNYPPSLLQLHRKIESLYQKLPWPKEVNNILLFNETQGGYGDISMAAKVIRIMEKFSPTLSFDWITIKAEESIARSFLDDAIAGKVQIRNYNKLSPSAVPADFLIVGPVRNTFGTPSVEYGVKRKIQGPRIDILQNAYATPPISVFNRAFRKMKSKPEDLYPRLHRLFFPTQIASSKNTGETKTQPLAMGLDTGSGIFSGVLLDEKRLNATLSRKGYCPNYLLQLEDEQLGKDILTAFGMTKEQPFPGEEKYAFNFGYAHNVVSWARFIRFSAVREHARDLIIVLTQSGVYKTFDTQSFSTSVFTSQLLSFLKNWGYSDVILKGKEKEPLVLLQDSASQGHKLTVIIRPFIEPNDVMRLQLAAKGLMGTGDNSAAEPWAAQCELFVFENVANGALTGFFVEQQISLAKTVSSDLSRLIQLGAKKTELSDVEMDEAIKILQDPSLAENTLKFCKLIREKHAFNQVLEAAFKRAAWTHCLPELMNEEIAALGDAFKTELIAFLKDAKNPEAFPRTLVLENLPHLAERIEFLVNQHLKADE